jgi:multiple sugar transport system permease protein
VRSDRKAARRSFVQRYWFVYALVLPAVAYRLLWTAWPLVQTFYLSLTDTNFVFRTSAFIGLENYASLLDDAEALSSVILTLGYTVGTVAGEIVLGLLLALLLNERLVGRQIGRTTLLIPWGRSCSGISADLSTTCCFGFG